MLPIGSNEQGKILLQIARAAIADVLCAPYRRPAVSAAEDWLSKPGATFVTLTEESELRGCIGSLQAYRPLADDVMRNAVSAAFRDPRFMPLTESELSGVCIEVSLLSELQPLGFSDETEALAQLRPHVDGIVFEYGDYRSTLLPQVWKSFSQPRQFLAQLKLKARLPENFWDEEVKLSRYTLSKWREIDFAKEYAHG
ncbi:MAG: AmmeMemoRadiSam system protein A [Nitrosomonas sp.]|nr:MAG: AmmeMemoRadiSam system protein A [Nitrosomonas sp.]